MEHALAPRSQKKTPAGLPAAGALAVVSVRGVRPDGRIVASQLLVIGKERAPPQTSRLGQGSKPAVRCAADSTSINRAAFCSWNLQEKTPPG